MLPLKINTVLLACVITLLVPSTTKATSTEIPQDKIEAFSQSLITMPSLKIQTPRYKVIKLISSLAIGAAFWFDLSFNTRAISFRTTKQPEPTLANPQVKLCDSKEEWGFFYNKYGLLITLFPAIFITRYAFKKMNEWLLSQEEQKAFKEYLENWEVNKNTVPPKLQKFLSDIHEQYTKNPDQVDLAEATRIVKKLLLIQKNKNLKNDSRQKT